MAWQGVHITRGGKLTLKHNSIIITQEEETSIPLEDLSYVVVDTHQVTMTTALLSAFAKYAVHLIITDERHHPSGIYLPFQPNQKQTKIFKSQLNASLPLKKRMWQSIVCQKIQNQASVLNVRNLIQASNKLDLLASTVRSGDIDNVEAHAARVYWASLWDGFSRRDPSDVRNAVLNYGYSVVRSAIAKSCVAHGLIPSLGFFHSSETNNFNLADDLIEPYRPIVDSYAISAFEQYGSTDFSAHHRRHMVSVLTADVFLDAKDQVLLSSVDTVVRSAIGCLISMDHKDLILPSLK